jgi:hypothetical protein
MIMAEPKHDRCHHRRLLACDFDAAKHSSRHQVGVLLVTGSTGGIAVVTGSGAPSAT